MASFFLSVSMSPTLQKTLIIPDLVKDTVNRTGEYRFDVAGKGANTCRVLAQLGKNCRHLTQLGGILRPVYLELCREEGLQVEWVESFSPIRFCYTILDKGDNSVTELVEESERVGEGTEERLLKVFSALIPECSVLVIAGTKAAGFSEALIPQMVKLGRAAGCRIILDVRGKDLLSSLPFGPDLVKPNLLEFASTFAPELISQNAIQGDASDVKEKVGKIWADVYAKYPCAMVLTRGAQPVWYAEKGELSEYSFEAVHAVNTTGSGDAFNAGIAAALEDGASLGEAVANGAKCGALNAGLVKPGSIK